MTARKIVLFAGMALAMVSFAAPGTASAFKLVKVKGGAITQHTEIHYTFDARLEVVGTGFECELNGTITTKDGTKATTEIINSTLITKSCKAYGFLYEGCEIKKDIARAPENEKITFDNNAFTFNFLILISEFGGGCNPAITFTDVSFEPLKITVGTNAINVGIIEGNGEAENDFGIFGLEASGEMTLGQYTENGVNQGSAKGVFKIE